ncbi:class I SAM-dependent methyltransferase [Streptomyces sp. NBC_00986]|uniref:class I SAM-dependent methyltransferase n=1 Tax=Streptomyces sp. NBC_00986 TaxID=2903702 RepID=UPI00386ACB33|nr:class I SAM-dependent methyltransferase [Streptomyces sp. NBC_00986]
MTDPTQRQTQTAFDTAERTMWSGRAHAYAASFARLCAHPVERLLDAAGIQTGTYVLDVGTGTGTVALAALARGARVSAVDADAGMVAVARAGGVEARVAALPQLPFPDGEFEAVVGNFVINHVGRPRAALTELRRVLKPGGRVALTFWGARRGAGQELFGRAFAAAEAVIPADLPRLDPAEDFARTADGFAELLREAGSGFTDARAVELEWDHRTTLDEWWGGPAAGVATAGLVVTSQDKGTVVRIRREYERLAGEFAVGGHELALPHIAVLACGRAD